MKTLIVTSVVLVIAVAFGYNRHNRLSELQTENVRLESRTRTIPELEDEIARLEAIEIDTNNLEILRGETVELMRLRAEVARLRPLVEKSKTELEDGIQQRKSTVLQAEANLDYEINWLADHAISQFYAQASDILSEKISQYIGENEEFPVSLENFRNDISEFNKLISSSIAQDTESMASKYIALGDPIGLQDFELILPPSDMETWNRPYIVLREKSPRQLQDGSWERNYGMLVENLRTSQFRPYKFFIDTDTVKLEDGDFEKWEREFVDQNSSN